MPQISYFLDRDPGLGYFYNSSGFQDAVCAAVFVTCEGATPRNKDREKLRGG